MKQKIIRLTTDNEEGVFDTFINDDLTLKKDSKIALLNVKSELKNIDFVIDQTNNKFGFMLDIDNDQPTYVYLESNAYNDTNIVDFFNDWTQKHNRAVNKRNINDGTYTYGNTIRGFEFFYSYQNDPYNQSRINGFEFGYGLTLDALKNFNTNQMSVYGCELNVDQTAIITSDPVEPGTIVFNTPLARGGGGFKVVLPTVSAGDTFIVGLLDDQNAVELKNALEPTTEVKFGYRYEFVGGQFRLRRIIDSILTVDTYNAQPGDEIMIMYSDNKIFLTALDNGVYQPLFNGQGVAYDHIQNLFGVITMTSPTLFLEVDNNKCQVYSSWVYNNSISNTDSQIWNVNKTWTKKRLYFSDREVLNDLGFIQDIFRDEDNNFYIEVNTDKSPTKQGNYFFQFSADNRINIIDSTTSYIVELQNISLEFYDSLGAQRKNYIMTFSNQEPANLTSLMYNTDYPIFINVKSVSDQMLRVIKARILKEDGTPIQCVGTSVITLLIQEE